MGVLSREIVVCTSWQYSSTVESVWPLLCNSKMAQTDTFLFKLGLPRPLECRLPNGTGGEGDERECISDKGTIHQRILVWKPGERLSFQMESADFSLMKGIEGVEDRFDLLSTPSGITMTRTTTVRLRGPLLFLKKVAIFLGLKQIHRYVFLNWQRIDTNKKDAAEESAPTLSHVYR